MALEDFDLLQAEDIASVPARITHAVTIEVVPGGKAANIDIIALGTAFARVKRDTRYVSQRLNDSIGALVLDELLGDDVDGLRGILESGRQAPHARLRGLIAAILIAGNVDGR